MTFRIILKPEYYSFEESKSNYKNKMLSSTKKILSVRQQELLEEINSVSG
jgi:hypothetical protein